MCEIKLADKKNDSEITSNGTDDSDIIKEAFERMKNRAESENNQKLVEELDNLIESEEAYYNKLIQDKDKFKEVWNSTNNAKESFNKRLSEIKSKIDVTDDSRFGYEKDCDHIIETIDDVDLDKTI